jgi:hypothetical protein
MKEAIAILARPLTARGWGKFNLQYWANGGYADFVRWWAEKMLPEPHSTKQIEDAIAWSHETDGVTLRLSAMADRAAPATRRDQIELANRVRCPVLVIHGTDDRVTPYADGKALAHEVVEAFGTAMAPAFVTLLDESDVHTNIRAVVSLMCEHGRLLAPASQLYDEFARQHAETAPACDQIGSYGARSDAVRGRHDRGRQPSTLSRTRCLDVPARCRSRIRNDRGAAVTRRSDQHGVRGVSFAIVARHRQGCSSGAGPRPRSHAMSSRSSARPGSPASNRGSALFTRLSVQSEDRIVSPRSTRCTSTSHHRPNGSSATGCSSPAPVRTGRAHTSSGSD